MSSQNHPANDTVQIFIDLDGVIADFDAHAKAEGKYDAAGRVIWDKLDYAWWSTMPVCTGAKAFYDAACKMGTVKFLTAPVLSEECFSGKAHWIQNFVPERGKFILQDFLVCPSGDKRYIAGPGRILVDDRENNIKEWVAAGGIGIHHTGDFSDTMRKLQAALQPVVTRPMLIAVAGMSGSGKSTLAAGIATGTSGAVHLDSDRIRKDMFGVSETTRLPPEAYSAESNQRFAVEVRTRIKACLTAGKTVVLSATMLSLPIKQEYEAIARECQAAFLGFHLNADIGALFDRVSKRVNDASDAGVDIVKMQASHNADAANWLVLDGDKPAPAVLKSALDIVQTVRSNTVAAPKPQQIKPPGA